LEVITGVAIRLQLFGFQAHVAELSKVLIKSRDWYVLSHRGSSDQTVDKVSLRSLIATQRVQVDPRLIDLDARAGDQASECGGNSRTWVPVKRLKHKNTLRQNDRQHHDNQIAPIAGIEQLFGCSCMFVVVLYQIADD
jgi:hypothetical protein